MDSDDETDQIFIKKRKRMISDDEESEKNSQVDDMEDIEDLDEGDTVEQERAIYLLLKNFLCSRIRKAKKQLKTFMEESGSDYRRDVDPDPVGSGFIWVRGSRGIK